MQNLEIKVMKRIIYIVIAALLFSVGCEKSNTGNDAPVEESSLTFATETIAGHEAVVVKPADIEADAPVVVVLAEDTELRTLAVEKPNVNFKAAEHCLIGRYVLCIIATGNNGDVSFLNAVKDAFPEASKFYLLSYRNGLSYTAAMRMPEAFAAYGCVSGAIDVETYKAEDFRKPVSFVHVHATGNPTYKWDGTEGKSVSVPLSVGAVVAKNKCISFSTTELLPREGKGHVSCTRYFGGESGCDVMLYRVESANRGWCDEEFEVYNQIWNFLKTH